MIKLAGKCIFILAIFLILPNFSKSAVDSITLTQSLPNCVGSQAQIVLSWTSTMSESSTYYILRKPEGVSEYAQIGSTHGTSYIDVSVESDKDYTYKIRGEDGASIIFSNEKSAGSAYCPAVLSLPASSCEADGPHIALTWTSVSGNLAKYEVHRINPDNSETVFPVSTVSYKDGPDISGTQSYKYFIRAFWSNGTTRDSDIALTQAPSCAPTLAVSSNCLAADPGGPQINLSWNILLGVQKYQIYRKALGETIFSLAGETNSPSLTTFNDSLTQSMPSGYYQGGNTSYYVKAVWGSANKDSLVKGTAIPVCFPFLAVQNNCDEFSMRLSWTKTLGATHYNVYKEGIFTAQITQNIYTDFLNTSICPNKSCAFNYRVDGVVIGQSPLPSNGVTKNIDCSIVTAPSPAPVVSTPSAFCSAGDSRVGLSWTPSNNVTYYTLYRNGISLVSLTGTSYEDEGVESGVAYTYTVTAFGAGGTFANSTNGQTINAVSCVPPSASIISTPISKACGSGKPSVTLSWSQTTNTTEYELRRGPSSGNLSQLIAFNSASPEFSSRIWKDTGVLPSTTYFYQILSKGPPGVPSTNSSNIPSVATDSCFPSTPVLSVVNGCSAQNRVANLSWTTSANTTRYEIFRNDYSLTVPIKIIYDPTVTLWQDTGLLSSASYTYRVTAVGEETQRADSANKFISAYNCALPGAFSLSEPLLSCQGPYPKADLSWTASPNASSYDLKRNKISPAGTTVLPNVSSPFSDRGFGNALSFNGSNNYVNILNSPSLQITGDLTIGFWAYPTNISKGRQNPIGKAYGGEFDLTMETNGSLSYYQGSAGGNASPYMSCSIAGMFLNNTWAYVTIVRDMDNKKIYAYKNGVSQTISCSAWVAPSISTRNIVIGFEYAGYWQGLIDEARIYRRILSTTEIQEHYQGIYTNETGLRGLWHFDEGAGASASDSSNFGNNGTINGASWQEHGPQSQATYTWQAEAKGQGGSTISNVTSQAPMPFCGPLKPGIVLAPFCESTGAPAIRLTWSYAGNVSKYEIYRDAVLVKTITSADSEFSLRSWVDNNNGTGLEKNKSYAYYVKVTSPNGLTSQSDSISATTLNCALPSQPKNVATTFSCSSSSPRVNLAWNASQNTTYYKVYRTPSSAVFPVSTANTSWTDTGVSVNTQYSYYVIAEGPAGESPFSDTSTLTTGYCAPSLPSIISLTTQCQSLAPLNKISWSDATTFNTTKYEIYRGSTTNLVKTINKGDAEFTARIWQDNLALSSLTNYTYWIRTTGPAGNKLSSSKSISTYSCGVVLTAPTLSHSLSCVQNFPLADLSWSSSPNAYSYNLARTNPDATVSTYSTRLSPFSDKGTYGLSFDGYNNYIDISSSSNLNPKVITMEAWVYPTGYNYYGNIIVKRDANQYIMRFYDVSGRIQGYVYSGGGWLSCTTPSTITAPLNQWSHITHTYDGATGKVYINGVLGCSYSGNGDISAGGGAPLRVGSYSANPTNSERFKGSMDEVRIYGRALSAAEVLSHYNGIYTNEADLRGAWHFDEGSGASVSDSSGNSNTGVIYGATWSALQAGNPTYIPKLEREKPYKYSVKAIGADTMSAPSNEVSFTTPSCLPSSPNFAVIAQCDNQNSQLELSWGNDPNTQYWSVYKRRQGEALFIPIIDVASPSTGYIDSNLESGVVYEYYLSACGQSVCVPSNIVSKKASFCQGAPSKPLVTVVPQCQGYTSRVLVNWNADPGGKAIAYNVLRDGVLLPEATGLAPAILSYNDFNVFEGVNYGYQVEAVGSGVNTFSDAVGPVQTLPCSSSPPFPPTLSLNLVYSVGSATAVSLSWTDAGNEKSYKIFRRQKGETFFAYQAVPLGKKLSHWLLGENLFAAYENPLVTLGEDILNYTDYTATQGVDYEYQVRAENANGITDSNIIFAPVPIGTPGNFTLSGGSTGGVVNLTWSEAESSAAGGAVTYTVMRDSSNAFDSPTTICVTISLSCIDSSPISSKIYYKVRAVNNGGFKDSNIWKKFIFPRYKEVVPQ